MTLPNLSSVSRLSLDIETRNDDIKIYGPAPRRGGYICSLAIAAEDRVWSWNLAHPGDTDPALRPIENQPAFYAWLEDTLRGKEAVTANGLYDFDFLQYKINPDMVKIHRDVQTAAFLLNEHRGTYTLDSLAAALLDRHKEKDGIAEYAAERGWKGDARAHIWKMPFSVVKPYVEADALLTLQVYEKQIPLLTAQELDRVFDIECRLIPVLLRMRKVGVPIDWARLEEVKHLMDEMSTNAVAELAIVLRDNGFNPDTFNYDSSTQLAQLFDALKIQYGMTSINKNTKCPDKFKPKPSFTKGFLEELYHPIGQTILDVRASGKVSGTFIHQLEMHRVGDRVHPIFHPTKVGDNGTEYGRFSCTMPALQTIPGDKTNKFIYGDDGQPLLDKYGDELIDPMSKSKLVRGLFIPEPGHWIAAPDYSQADYRFFAHFAQGPGAKQIQDYFQDEEADMHKFTASMAGIPRKAAKAPNFGIMFGMGAPGLSRNTGKPLEEAQQLLSLIKQKVPALKDTPKAMQDIWKSRGWVRTILGRRARLVDKEAAYRAIAMIIGGSTADLMKKSMVDTYEAGIHDILPCHITMHDEMVNSVPPTKQGLEALREMREIMRKVFDLRVPLKVSAEASPKSWADVSEAGFKELEKMVEGV